MLVYFYSSRVTKNNNGVDQFHIAESNMCRFLMKSTVNGTITKQIILEFLKSFRIPNISITLLLKVFVYNIPGNFIIKFVLSYYSVLHFPFF